MGISYRKAVFKIACITASAVLLIIAGGMFLSLTALGREREAFREQKEYYKALEQEYIKDMRDFLAGQGYADSGVTMNRVIEEDGSLQYIVTIHHSRISQLGPKAREQLLTQCKAIEFQDKECGFCHKFLEDSF